MLFPMCLMVGIWPEPSVAESPRICSNDSTVMFHLNEAASVDVKWRQLKSPTHNLGIFDGALLGLALLQTFVS